jgi:hypothetical protein
MNRSTVRLLLAALAGLVIGAAATWIAMHVWSVLTLGVGLMEMIARG